MSGGVFGGEVIVCRSLYVNMYGDHKLARQITSNFAPALVRAKHARETAVVVACVNFQRDFVYKFVCTSS